MHVITLSELAEELRVEPSTAPATLRKLVQHHGFPRALPGLPGRWSRHLVSLWFRTNGHQVGAFPAHPANDSDSAATDPVAEHQSLLEARYGAKA